MTGPQGWPPEAVRFRRWDFERRRWYFRTTISHRPRSLGSALTACGLDWFGSHTVNVDGPATCKRCSSADASPGATDA